MINVHSTISQLKQLPAILGPNVMLYITDPNPILPVGKPMLTAIEADDDCV